MSMTKKEAILAMLNGEKVRCVIPPFIYTAWFNGKDFVYGGDGLTFQGFPLGNAPSDGYEIVKQKVKHKKVQWVNIYKSGPHSIIHKTKEKADDWHNGWSAGTRISCVPITIEWETEE